MPDRLLVLMFHDVGATPGDPYSVSDRAFDEILDVVTGGADGAVPCHVTFDDGHLGTFRHALAALTAHGVEATVFATVRFLGLPGFMDAAMLREWHAAGQRVGSHGLTHRPLTTMTACSAEIELRDSKRRLEDLIGAPVQEFSFPGGNESAFVRELAFATGYSRLYTSKPQFANARARVLPRFAIRARTPAGAVAALRSGRVPREFFGDRLRWAVRCTLGGRLYEAIRYHIRPSTLPDIQ